MISLNNISYTHPNKDILFENLSLAINRYDKIALIGNNGAGKTTLLKLLAGILKPTNGHIQADTPPYYVPQIYGQYNHHTVAEVLQVANKLVALKQILAGDVTDENLTTLNDDWTLEERCQEAFEYWQLNDVGLNQKLDTLSGGQKTKVLLAGINIHQPEVVLLDEPSNHLDTESRQLLYNFIQSTTKAIMVVSHDRKLLNLLKNVFEINKGQIIAYGGNYEFYLTQKQLHSNALINDIKEKEKALRAAKETEREANERKQRLDARGKGKQIKAGTPTIMQNTLRNSAEKSTARLKEKHNEKIGTIAKDLNDLRKELPEIDKMKFDFDYSNLHKGKILVKGGGLNYEYNNTPVWKQPISFIITSGERIAIKGKNGSGKTTLIRIILGDIPPAQGSIYSAISNSVYIDQDYTLINDELSVFEQVNTFNNSGLQKHEVNTRLARFLFTEDFWDKPCKTLSGGEKMRLLLCCITIGNKAPDVIILDEPTNNLDMQNIEILAVAINSYKGTLLIISHDEHFLEQLRIQKVLALN
jgi:ATPase subunit of ABC transporter with duplicated ATPase domains